MPTRGKIVTQYVKLWTRDVFDLKDKQGLVVRRCKDLQHPGVYILYRDDHPYYIGKTRRTLFNRLHDHANKSTDTYFNFWNYFSAFVVPDASHLNEVEGILIASLPTANRAVPNLTEIKMPPELRKLLKSGKAERNST